MDTLIARSTRRLLLHLHVFRTPANVVEFDQTSLAFNCFANLLFIGLGPHVGAATIRIFRLLPNRRPGPTAVSVRL